MDNLELWDAEKDLLHALLIDEPLVFPKSDRSHGGTRNAVRGSFLSNLLKSRLDIKVPPSGVRLEGAEIFGDVDISGYTIDFCISLERCTVFGDIDCTGSSIRGLILKGSKVGRLKLSDMTCDGSVILSYGFRTLHTVFARGSKIRGQLGCSGGEFAGHPLAISLESAVIEEAFFWRFIKDLWGIVDLTNLQAGCLIDDRDSWPKAGKLRLSGFRYGSMESNTSSLYFDRLEWLKRQYEPHLTYDFRPQPFEHLVKVLKESGREEEARKIAICKLHLQRDSNFLRWRSRELELKQKIIETRDPLTVLALHIKLAKESMPLFDSLLLTSWSSIKWLSAFLFWAVAGYGYRPMRCAIWSVALIVVGGFVFSYQKDAGNFQYRSEQVNRVNKYHQSNNSTFFPYAYAADLFIPIVDLGQSKQWYLRADPEKIKQPFLLFSWVYIFLGWVFAAIFAASITGIIRK